MPLVSVAQHIRVGNYERLNFLVHSTFEWGVKSVEQKASYAKSKQATEPQIYTYTVAIGGYIHSEFHAIPLHGYGETPSKLSTTQ